MGKWRLILNVYTGLPSLAIGGLSFRVESTDSMDSADFSGFCTKAGHQLRSFKWKTSKNTVEPHLQGHFEFWAQMFMNGWCPKTGSQPTPFKVSV